MLCQITGSVVYPDGTPVANETLVFRRADSSIMPGDDGALIPRKVLTKTDDEGQINVALYTGQYEVCAGGFHGIVYVPDAPAADFGDILIESSIPATPPQWYLEALRARDEAVAAAERAKLYAVPFSSRAAAEAAEIPADQDTLLVYSSALGRVDAHVLAYVRDPDGTALTTADGGTWSPAGTPTSAHWGSPLNAVDDDAPAIQAALDWAVSHSARSAIVSGAPYISQIAIPGEIDVSFEGPQTAIGLSDFSVVVRPGAVERRSKIHGLNLIGNTAAEGGVLLTGAQYWTFYDPVISGYTRPGAWAMVLSGDEANRNASSNVLINPNFSNCHNLLKFGKNPEIVGSQNTGASFNTVVGGYLGPFGDNTDEFQFGIQDEVGEGNKFLNVRVSTNKHHTVPWDIMDARTQCIGCAGDGPCFTAFVYPLGGTGTVDSITLLGTTLLETPVAWAGSRMATSEAIVAQIEADGNQYPDSEFMALAHDEQVMFFRIDGDGNKVRLDTNEIGNIAVTASGVTVGHSGINSGLLQGAPYTNYPDVPVNKWGYRAGHGGVLEVYSFRFRANPEGSGRGGGALIEPEGNGPRHIVWFDSEVTQRATNVLQAGSNILSGGALATDAVQENLDGQIQVAITSGNGTVAHAQQRLRTINFGPLVFAEIALRFTPTFTTNGQIYFEFPQAAGLFKATAPLDVNGMQYNIPITISGTSLTQQPYLSIFGGQVSPNGHPFARLMTAQGTIVTTSVMTSGQEVSIRGWGHWPVNRFT